MKPSDLSPFSSLIISEHFYRDIGHLLNSGISIKLVDKGGEVDLEQNKRPRFGKKNLKRSAVSFVDNIISK